jgi:hypothetical protein
MRNCDKQLEYQWRVPDPPDPQTQRPDVRGHAGANCETTTEEQVNRIESLVVLQAERLCRWHPLSVPVALVLADLIYRVAR